MDDGHSDALERWIVYRQLCDLLSLAPIAARDDWRWEKIVALASRHLVSPALVDPVARIPSAPEDLRDYLSELRAMNLRRNAIIADALLELNAALLREGVRPVYLKGAASLVTGLYDDPGERVMGDIDVLIAQKDIDVAGRLLRNAGYVFSSPDEHGKEAAAFHHLPMAIHADTGVGIELHRATVRQEHRTLLPADQVLSRATSVRWRGQSLAVPDATDRAIHNVVHDQLQDNGAKRGVGSLRQLREFARLAARHHDAIDWTEIETRFSHAGHSDVLAARATYCRFLMGVALPVREADEATALPVLRHGIRRLSRTETALALAGLYVRNLRRRPERVLNLLSPARWPARIRGWRDHFARR